jgi:hypothetical protein
VRAEGHRWCTKATRGKKPYKTRSGKIDQDGGGTHESPLGGTIQGGHARGANGRVQMVHKDPQGRKCSGKNLRGGKPFINRPRRLTRRGGGGGGHANSPDATNQGGHAKGTDVRHRWGTMSTRAESVAVKTSMKKNPTETGQED